MTSLMREGITNPSLISYFRYTEDVREERMRDSYEPIRESYSKLSMISGKLNKNNEKWWIVR